MTQVISQKEQNKLKQERKIRKALLISRTKRVRYLDADRKIWLVQSGNPKTPKKFYCVVWDEELEAFICDCPDFQYNCAIGDLCCHICAAALKEGGGE
jgi:hypothetical protein